MRKGFVMRAGLRKGKRKSTGGGGKRNCAPSALAIGAVQELTIALSPAQVERIHSMLHIACGKTLECIRLPSLGLHISIQNGGGGTSKGGLNARITSYTAQLVGLTVS